MALPARTVNITSWANNLHYSLFTHAGDATYTAYLLYLAPVTLLSRVVVCRNKNKCMLYMCAWLIHANVSDAEHNQTRYGTVMILNML